MMAPLDPRTAVLNVARALGWVRETAGANRGEVVDRMIRACGLEPPQPWCMAYVNFCGKAALDLSWPLPMAAGCQYVAEAAQPKGLLGPTPERGAVFLLWSDQLNRFRHTGFLVRADDEPGWWVTIEGNTNEGGSPEGVGVFRRRRHFARADRFIHYWL